MDVMVAGLSDPADVLAQAGDLLAADPVRNNVMLTLLNERVATGEPGRYWLATAGEDPAGVVFQSPLHFPVLVTPMPDEVTGAVVDFIVDSGAAVPGVNGDVATSARFAGQWTERSKSAAAPVIGMRLYEVRAIRTPTRPAGEFRRATTADRAVIVDWLTAFGQEVGERPDDAGEMADTWIGAGQVFVWQNSLPTSMAVRSDPVAGVSRIRAVYTPPDQRARGYAAACVAELSQLVLDEGVRCILYTDLGNPVSNSVYRRIGYQAVMESLRYEFR